MNAKEAARVYRFSLTRDNQLAACICNTTCKAVAMGGVADIVGGRGDQYALPSPRWPSR